MSNIKFQIYYSTTADGPWTLANTAPVDIDITGNNSYTITGLNSNTKYYITLVGGTIKDSIFYPLINQHIGPRSSGAGNLGAITPVVISTKTFAPSINRNESIGQEFAISSIV